MRQSIRGPVAVAVTAGVILAVLMSCGARGADADSGAVAPVLPGRPVASRVPDPVAVSQLQERLDLLSAADADADCGAQYQSNKIQAWLNFARYAAQNAVPAKVQAAALRKAGDLLDNLERHGAAPAPGDDLPQSRHIRDDLWRSVKAVRDDGRWCSAPKMTAYCEVQLAWSDYEAGAGGWRHVDPYIRIAEDYCAAASRAVVPAAPLAIADAVPAPAPASAPALVPAAGETGAAEPQPAAPGAFDAPMVVRFPHDRAKPSDIRPPGRQILRRFAEHFRTLPADTTVRVVGHADITGTNTYNLALSARRARSVVLELTQWGIDPSRIHIVAAGDGEPEVSCRLNSRARRAKRRYIACLEPNRRVVVELQGGH
jgi:outer membrane protein OmpA-like peptidoglycan-associated protein